VQIEIAAEEKSRAEAYKKVKQENEKKVKEYVLADEGGERGG
jgi:hypothetical protein